MEKRIILLLIHLGIYKITHILINSNCFMVYECGIYDDDDEDYGFFNRE